MTTRTEAHLPAREDHEEGLRMAYAFERIPSLTSVLASAFERILSLTFATDALAIADELEGKLAIQDVDRLPDTIARRVGEASDNARKSHLLYANAAAGCRRPRREDEY